MAREAKRLPKFIIFVSNKRGTANAVEIIPAELDAVNTVVRIYDMDLQKILSGNLMLVRQQSPLIHNITNYVAMEMSANVLLAIGASPIMSSEPDEVAEIVSASSALAINIGCLEQKQAEAMKIAAAEAVAQSKPWVLDPAGAGLSNFRMQTAQYLISNFKPAVIRGNASEIMVLAGAVARTRGVDSAEDSTAAVRYAVRLARDNGTVVSLSGETDFITDGETILAVQNGNPVMSSVTAMGCSASAVTAAFLAVCPDTLAAAASAMALMGIAGEAAGAASNGPGTFAVNFIDCISNCNIKTSLVRYEQKQA